MNQAKQIQSGMGLIEALISIVIMGIMVTGIWMMNGTNSRTMSHVQYRNNAIEIGQYVLDSLALRGPFHPSLDVGVQKTGVVTQSNGKKTDVRYTVVYTIAVQDTDNQGFTISKKINMNVSWTMSNHTSSIFLNGVVK